MFTPLMFFNVDGYGMKRCLARRVCKMILHLYVVDESAYIDLLTEFTCLLYMIHLVKKKNIFSIGKKDCNEHF